MKERFKAFNAMIAMITIRFVVIYAVLTQILFCPDLLTKGSVQKPKQEIYGQAK